jgi:branched-chain amino acid transport system substrate-binding protein
VLALALAALLALLVAGTANADGIQPLPATSCGAVEYAGAGTPDVLVASDLPMNGASQGRSEQMVDAIRQVLAGAGWQAGGHHVALQVCDDSLATTGAWDAQRCRDNAQAYAANAGVFGVIGTYNSGCAAEMLPILNQAPGGAVGLVSPGNTLVCLTQSAATCPKTQPASFFPSGSRSYVRVVPNDAGQAAGLVTSARKSGVRRPYVLYAADDPTSLGQAQAFRRAAKSLKIPAIGFRSWNPKAKSYRALMRKVARSHPDAVVLAGLTEQHGGALIKAKVAVMGANSGRVALLAPDGFAQQSTITQAGAAARGMEVSLPGRAPSALTGPGKALVQALQAKHKTVELYAPYAGQAAAVLLDAIARGAGGRGAVTSALFATKVQNGIVGSFAFDASGDPTVGPITIYRAGKTFTPVREVRPTAKLTAVARG